MSAQTKAALDEAIAAHLRDECEGAIVTGYVLHASYLNPDVDSHGSTGYYAELADGQPYHVGLGLAHQLVQHYHAIWQDNDEE